MKKFSTIFTISILALIAFFSFELISIASNFQPPTIIKPDLLPGPDSTEVAQATEGSREIILGKFLPRLTVRIIGLIGAAALLSIVIGGVRYATAYGKDETLEAAKNQILYSIIGFIVAILSYTIVTIVSNVEFKGDNSTPAQGPPVQQNP